MRLVRLLIAGTAVLSTVVVVPSALGKKKDSHSAAAQAQMDSQKRVVHALNRLTFGPRPGDMDRVSAMGVDKWIDQQLHPERISDDALDARLAPLRTLQMSSREMAENFPSEQLIKGVINGKFPVPRDPELKAVYAAQMDRYQERLAKKDDKLAKLDSKPDNKLDNKKDEPMQVAVAKPEMTPVSAPMAADIRIAPAPEMTMENKDPERGDRLQAEAIAQNLYDIPADQRLQAILKLSTADQRLLARAIRGDKRDHLLDGMPPKDREIFAALNNPQQVVNDELAAGKILRATYTERQLDEVMNDFWFNHFNIFMGKGADRYMLTSYERDVIRPHALGKFEDLLVATAESPAMLFYLDNWLSVGPNSDFANGIKRNPRDRDDWRKRARQNGPIHQAKGKNNGLNENYGRELMELHTLGVTGGYTQTDVTELARILTGWTIKEPREGGGFFFDERKHEPGEKILLGHRIKPNGEKEGREALHILAHNPATAKFISTKLAMRFVADDPPPALVAAMTQTFLKKDGDIREVLRTMLRSPEFWAADNYRAKVKTPLEFTVSALRASGAEVNDALPIVRQLQTFGMPLYGMQPPTGYSMKAGTWVNSSALLGRMNFALALTAGRFKGIKVDLPTPAPNSNEPSDPYQTLTMLETSYLAGDVSQQTHQTIEAQLQNPGQALTPNQKSGRAKPQPPSPNATVAGLILGSPEFQRR